MPEEVHSLKCGDDIIQACWMVLSWLLVTCGLCLMCLNGHRGERIAALNLWPLLLYLFIYFSMRLAGK